MTVHLELSPDTQARLEERAAASGLPIETYLKNVIERLARNDEAGAATRRLFDQWRKEDQTDDPEEIEARNRELEEFKAAMNASRPGQRKLFP